MFEIIAKYFPDLSNDQIEKFKKLEGLYKDWNQKINVVSRKDIDELYMRHVLHSLGIAAFHKFEDGLNILDVGTGGGFPGIPLAIMFPNCDFTLVDSIGKKLKVVNAVVEELGLTNVKTIHNRVEKVDDRYDFVVSRAVTQMPEFVSWVKNKFKRENTSSLQNGIIYLKGGDLTQELKNYSNVVVKDLKDYFEEDFFETKKVVYLRVKGGK
jgi:16S rRNA (guanine527-N7)-methyltransferase